MITLTEPAAEYIKTLLERDPSKRGLHIGVKKAGCSGMSYTMELIGVHDEPLLPFSQHGVTVFVSEKDLAFLNATQLDYINQGINKRILISNPQEVARCGCGESFAVSDK